MRVTLTKDKIALIADIIDPHNMVLWAAYVEDRMKEGKPYEEALKMADYHFKNSINLAATKAELIIKLLGENGI